jgi:hypothetical protein
MTTFPDLSGYRMVLVDDRDEITAMITAIFSATGVELTVTSAIDVAARLIRSYRPNLVLVATSIRGEPFFVVEAAQHNGVPVMALDFGSIGPEVSDRLRRRYGVAVARDVDDPEGLCHAAKRAATRRRKA